MFTFIAKWVDDRTGLQKLLHELLYERIPGGARWRYVWGSTLVFTFVVQVMTGFCLWAAYSPGVQNAWASVLHIEEAMFLGSFVRGLHHYAAQAMVILMAIHFLQIVVDGAYRAPREFNFWVGLILMQIVLGLALTGYLLPWDQKGYYATQVATKIMGATPVVGQALQELVVGGSEYGQHTLTRFFALHAGVLPSLLVVCLAVHLYLFRFHGIHARQPLKGPEDFFWPTQVAYDTAACLLVLIVLAGLAYFVGAELAAPANPAEPYAAARPEWYFLSLFRLLKFEVVEHFGLAFGAIFLPGMAMAYVVLMPFISQIRFGHQLNILVTMLLTMVVVGLTGLAWYEDRNNPDHQAAVAEAERDAERARELALGASRIPLEGPMNLLRSDPMTQGPRLFAKHCAPCHHYQGHDGRGRVLAELDPETGKQVASLPLAPDLGDLGSADWMRRVVLDFATHMAPLKNAPWFGKEEGIHPDESEMADWSGDRVALASLENKPNLDALIEFMLSETGRPNLKLDAAKVNLGKQLATEGTWAGAIEGKACTDCHATLGESFDPGRDEAGGYPDVAGYLSAAWLLDFLKDPGHPQYYGDKNQMPAFEGRMTSEELDLLVRWMTGT